MAIDITSCLTKRHEKIFKKVMKVLISHSLSSKYFMSVCGRKQVYGLCDKIQLKQNEIWKKPYANPNFRSGELLSSEMKS